MLDTLREPSWLPFLYVDEIYKSEGTCTYEFVYIVYRGGGGQYLQKWFPQSSRGAST
jgi:hypothetical protein